METKLKAFHNEQVCGCSSDIAKTVRCWDEHAETPDGEKFNNWETAKEYAEKNDFDRNDIKFISEGRSLREIRDELQEKINSDLMDHADYFNFERDYGSKEAYASQKWPSSYRWIAIFPVTGGSEGYYVHVDSLSAHKGKEEECHKTLLLAKFWEKKFAIEFAAKLAELLPV